MTASNREGFSAYLTVAQRKIGFIHVEMLLPLLLIVVLGGMFFFRNRQQNKARQEQKSKLAPGVEVMTNFGLFGRVLSIDTDANKIVLELSPGNTATVHSQTVARIIDAPAESEALPEASAADSFEVPDDASSLIDQSKAQPGKSAESSHTSSDDVVKPGETPEETLARLRRKAEDKDSER